MNSILSIRQKTLVKQKPTSKPLINPKPKSLPAPFPLPPAADSVRVRKGMANSTHYVRHIESYVGSSSSPVQQVQLPLTSLKLCSFFTTYKKINTFSYHEID